MPKPKGMTHEESRIHVFNEGRKDYWQGIKPRVKGSTRWQGYEYQRKALHHENVVVGNDQEDVLV